MTVELATRARTTGLLLFGLASGLQGTCTGAGPEGCDEVPPPECDSHDDCPKGQRCDLHPGPDRYPNQCVDRAERIGSSCDPDACVSCICDTEVVCVVGPDAGPGERGTCQLDCTTDDQCPLGYTCRLTDDGVIDYCVPVDDGGV